MKLQEAYSILELSPTASPEEAKKRYRDLSKKYHPDVNKADDATDKFKKINEAYQCVTAGKGTDREEQIDFQDHFSVNPFGRRRNIRASNIELHTTISFKESVLGVKKEIKYNRQGKCQECEGQGLTALDNGCDKCNGKGKITSQRGNVFITQSCNKCFGRMNMDSCKACNGSSTTSNEVSVSVLIPGGVVDNNILKMGGMGNYVGALFGVDQNTDTLLFIHVTPDSDLAIEDQDVISTISISLLEALKGCNKEIKTIDGNKEIEIKPKSRNKEEVILPNLGVNRVGNQRVILNINYPDNIDNLITALQTQEN